MPKDVTDNLYHHSPLYPDKRRLKISIVHRDTGAIFHMVRYFNEQLDNDNVLEQIWCEWNRGSKKESQQFLNTQTRSLSVGDVVTIQEGEEGPSEHYICIEEKGVSYFFTIPSAEALRRPFTGSIDQSKLIDNMP